MNRSFEEINTSISVQYFATMPGEVSDPAPIQLAVTYAVPIPTSNVEFFPVVIEMLPYRKDDSNKPLRYNACSAFAKRGFLHAYVDVRGTGGSQGKKPAYEYTEAELSDLADCIQKIAIIELTLSNGKVAKGNGKVGLWGQSWSSFNCLVVAGRKNRGDARLQALKTIVPIHGATDFYNGDIHYMDGILHQDEYIASIDHENTIPSTGLTKPDSENAYQFNTDFYNNRWTTQPWQYFYLTKQLNDSFWTDRTKFINGPFNNQNPNDYNLPTFVIGSLMDGYRDSTTVIYENLKNKGAPVKFAMGPSNHSLMDYASPGPNWEWRNEVSRWFWYWLVVHNENGPNPDKSLINQNDFAVYIRRPGNDANNVPGFWRNMSWPLGPATRYYMTPANGLTLTAPPANQESEHTLLYKPGVGTEMYVWWGENNASLGNMLDLDADSLIYDLPITSDMELIGYPTISLRVAARSAQNLAKLHANWHVRLEDYDPSGNGNNPNCVHVTGASFNSNFRNSYTNPSFVNNGQFYTITFKLHFSTWTFKAGHRARIAITNALFRMMWPTRDAMTTALKVNSLSSFVDLPLYPAQNAPNPKHPYEVEKVDAYVEPANGWYFAEGGYPRVYTNEIQTINNIPYTVSTWLSDYYSNCYGWIVSVDINHVFTQNNNDPADTKWETYARQKYQWIGTTDQNKWGNLFGYPSLNKPGPQLPPIGRQFTIETTTTLRSDYNNFHFNLDRKAFDSVTNANLVAPYTFVGSVARNFQ